ETENLSVNRIDASRPFAAINQSLAFTAQVQNRGARPSAATLLSWEADGRSLGVVTVPELVPGAATTLNLAHQFDGAGLFEVTCRLEGRDALAQDNAARFLVEVYERLPVLIVEEPNTDAPLEKDSAFVLAAFGARKGNETGWRSIFEPTVIEPAMLEGRELERFRCVILADVRRLAPGAIEKLEAYVRSGGGVWIALGKHTDAGFFNEHFHRGGLGLAPLKVGTPIGDPNDREKFFAIRTSLQQHPATALLSDFQRLDLDRARIYRRHQFDVFSGKDVSVLLQVQQGDPVAVERKLERGRVVVQSIPLGVSWSTLPLCQAYVAMLHEWLWYLAEPALPKRNLAPGQALLVSHPGESGRLTLPDNHTIDLQPAVASGEAQWRYAGTRLPGEHLLRIEGKEKLSTRFLVHRNPDESDLAGFSEAHLKQLQSTEGFSFGFDALAAGATVEAP
ncbi:MAG: CARDB domain-containing protein, partial [Verrucomicrobiota bacterium]